MGEVVAGNFGSREIVEGIFDRNYRIKEISPAGELQFKKLTDILKQCKPTMWSQTEMFVMPLHMTGYLLYQFAELVQEWKAHVHLYDVVEGDGVPGPVVAIPGYVELGEDGQQYFFQTNHEAIHGTLVGAKLTLPNLSKPMKGPGKVFLYGTQIAALYVAYNTLDTI